jgi:hypothetical protein
MRYRPATNDWDVQFEQNYNQNLIDIESDILSVEERLANAEGQVIGTNGLADNAVILSKIKNPNVRLMHYDSIIVDFQNKQLRLATAGSLFIYADNDHANYGAGNDTPIDLKPFNLDRGSNYTSYRIYIDRNDNNRLKVAPAVSVTGRNFTLGFIYQNKVIGNENGFKVIDANGNEVSAQKIANGAVSQVNLRNALWFVLQKDAVEINIKDKKVYLNADIHAMHGRGWYYLAKTTQAELAFPTDYTSGTTYKLYMDLKDSNKLKIALYNIDVGNNPIISYMFGANLITANPNAVYIVDSGGNRILSIPKSSLQTADFKNPIIKLLHPDTIQIDYTTNQITITSKDLWAFHSTGMNKYLDRTYPAVSIPADIMSSTDYNTWVIYLQIGATTELKLDKLQNLTGDARIITRIYQKRILDNLDAIKVIGDPTTTPSEIKTQEFAHVYQNGTLNIDTTNKKVILSAGTHLIGPNGSVYVTGNTYPAEFVYEDTLSGSYAKKLYWNRDTKSFGVAEYSKVIDANIFVLLYFTGTGSGTVTFDAFENYKRIKIDGFAWADRSESQAGGGPAPYNWSTNKYILPKELFLLKGIEYSINAQNFNFNKFTDNDSLLFEIVTPAKTAAFENNGIINSPIAVDFETYLAGVYNSDKTNALAKDIVLRFADPAKKTNKSPRVLCLGDSLTHANIPYLVKYWLENFGFSPTMIGTQNNGHESYGYGMEGTQPTAKGEGRGGWRLTDYTGTTKRTDGTIYLKPDNPFWNPTTQAFDFSYYMSNNGFSGVDFVVIMLGTNDITGYHGQKVAESIGTPTIDEILAYMPGEFQKIVDSILAYNPNCKIGLNPPVPAGGYDDFNAKLARYIEVLQANFDKPEQGKTYCLGSYLGNGRLSGKQWNGAAKTAVSDINSTYRIGISSDVHDAGNNQLVNALWSASWIINRSN